MTLYFMVYIYSLLPVSAPVIALLFCKLNATLW